jgi:hypothetical protein
VDDRIGRRRLGVAAVLRDVVVRLAGRVEVDAEEVLRVERSQMRGESKPSLSRSEMLWSLTATRPPPSRTKLKIAVDSGAVKRVFGSLTMNTSKFDRS